MAMEVGPNLPGVASEVLPVAPPSVVPPSSEVPPSGSGAAAGAPASVGAPRPGLHSATQDGESPASVRVISPAPFFPTFADRHAWAKNHEQLTSEETLQIVMRSEELLREKYYFAPGQISRWVTCLECGYPTATEGADMCPECRVQKGSNIVE